MAQLTVTAKGQITLKKELLEHLGVKPGDKLEVDLRAGDVVVLQPIEKKYSIEDLAGFLKPNGIHLTLEEINEVIEKGWAGELED
ncbi:AbrB/MazE/SpoVT family DNA-binding domain-containing protein [Silvibacterium dinghuense]|uniref:AbrB/MazE/SpoVT family DNA-binding domain-containing protein n=1 Tax=Silvibacterium dinghuense TaxID=1560006 RepID=A0A4Q1S8W3_9BACT|nr:AbrB/MazE/SpoVT family DNA-binding domain-containing protein [Silvibacterium dinghuense]RXS93381.1 AbrB/MazE/SpoVT family DNA-binding domain-containing protein [Silvibacterium dinghuense]GGH05360.1 hypothetical protein GCM10011586_21870 [Silvibacterium dinghuense]